MDGFTPAQRFFLAWGRVWASNVAPQFVAYIVNSDVHSPSISRVNAALPMIHCDCCGDVPVPYDQLPVMLPDNLDLAAGDTLAECKEFVETTCPQCGKPAKRITDTMDTFTCSSWYYLRYCDPHNTELPFSKESVDRWMPVDNYIGEW